MFSQFLCVKKLGLDDLDSQFQGFSQVEIKVLASVVILIFDWGQIQFQAHSHGFGKIQFLVDCWTKILSSSLILSSLTSSSSIPCHETEQSSERFFSVTDLFVFPTSYLQKDFSLLKLLGVSKSLAHGLMLRGVRTCRDKEQSGRRTGNNLNNKSAIQQSHRTFNPP